MIKKITCIECPKSCTLSVDIENCLPAVSADGIQQAGRVVKVSGNLCPKGDEYAVSEIENPMRILTSTVATEGLPAVSADGIQQAGLSLKMMPVRTDRPIPKAMILSATGEIRKIKLKRHVRPGDIIAPNFLGLNVNLIATRES